MTFWVAGAVVGSAVIGGLASSNAASSQANAANQAAQTSADTQMQMFNKQVELQQPWRDAGQTALNALTPLATNYQPFTASNMYADPGYQFRLSEGLKSLDHQAAARGGLISGGALKAAQQYGQGYASNEYQNAFNRYQTERNAQLNPLQSLAGVGQTSANELSNAAQNTGVGVANAYSNGITNAANARASGYVGQANALTGALNSGLNYYQNQQALNGLSGSGAYGATGGYSSPIYNPSSSSYDPYAVLSFG